MSLKDSNSIIKKASSGNSYVDSLEKIDDFITKIDMPVFVAGDNPKLIEEISIKHPNILYSKSSTLQKNCTSVQKCKGLHHYLGRKDPNNLKDVIVDLLILSGAKMIMTSTGGFSRLAKRLCERKDIRAKLLS
jgi:hypothetical protein